MRRSDLDRSLWIKITIELRFNSIQIYFDQNRLSYRLCNGSRPNSTQFLLSLIVLFFLLNYLVPNNFFSLL